MVFKKYFLVVGLLLIVSINFASAVLISDDLHLNIQVLDSGGDVLTGTYNFAFNISTTSNCASVIYTDSPTLTTDSRGIISYYLRNVSLDYNNQYWLCYYRNNLLINTSQIARVPYAFRARNVTMSGIEVDQNLNMGSYNITAPYFFGDGSSLTGITGNQINNTLNWINASAVNGSYYLISNPYGFYNSTSLANLSQLVDDLGNRGYTSLSNFTDNLGSRGYTHLTNFTDNLGNRGYTSLSNFSNNLGFYNSTNLPSSVSGEGVAGYVALWNGTNSLNSSVVSQLGVNVGIGTASPAARLDVRTGANDSILASFGVDANNRISLYDYETGGFRSIYAIDDGNYGSLNLGHGTSPYLFIKTGGNVGIGTANPLEKLEVSGRVNSSVDFCITGGNCLSDSIMGGSETDPLWTSNSSTVLNWNKTYADNLYYGLANSYGYYNSTSLTSLSQLTDNLGNRGYTHLSNFTDNILWTSGFNSTGDSRWLTSYTETDPQWSSNYSNVAFINKANSFGAYNQSFNTNTLFIDSSNSKVGVGTTNPQQQLDVVGNANVTQNLSVGNSTIYTRGGDMVFRV